MASGLVWSIDNAAFSGFDPDAFRRLLKRAQGQPYKWAVCPDVVGKAKETLQEFKRWEAEVRITGPIAFVLQDGQEDLELPVADAYFIGGSTEFKLSKAAKELADEIKLYRRAWLHMGRVNSKTRIKLAYEWGCDSIDGTGVSLFPEVYLAEYLDYIRSLTHPHMYQRSYNEHNR